MSADQILQFTQIGVSLITLGGLAFSVGRIYGRIEGLEKGQSEIKVALFGQAGSGGAYIRRDEMTLLREAADREHEILHKAQDDLLGRLEELERK